MKSLISKQPTELLCAMALLPEVHLHKQINRAFITAHDLQRHKLGTSLRDNVNQLLASAQLMLLQAQSHSNKKEHLEMIAKQIGTAIEETRRLSQLLTHSAVEDLGLGSSIEDLIGNMKKTCPMTVWFDYDPVLETLLTQEEKRMVHRVIREQVNNISRHANASHVVIAVQRQEDCFVILIGDDGAGADVQDLVTGSGLLDMYCRVNAFNGSMRIESVRGEGFNIDIKIPLTVH